MIAVLDRPYRIARRTKNRFAQLRAAWRLRHNALAIERQIKREGGFRAPGAWRPDDVKYYARTVYDVPGAFCEIGVRYGENFRTLVPLASVQEKLCYAVDSFEGAKKEGEFDSRPDHDMSIGGVQVFHDRMAKEEIDQSEYQTLVGWIPEVFNQFPRDVRFSLAVIDVDNYEATVKSLKYVWPRMNQGGVLLLDDFNTYHEMDAGRAYREFLRDENDYWLARSLKSDQLILRKE